LKRYSEMSKCAAGSAIAGCGCGGCTGVAPSAAEKLDAGLDVLELPPCEKYDDIEEKKQEASPATGADCW
jgi:hypothetical protein